VGRSTSARTPAGPSWPPRWTSCSAAGGRRGAGRRASRHRTAGPRAGGRRARCPGCGAAGPLPVLASFRASRGCPPAWP
jgi:hypothetical protein